MLVVETPIFTRLAGGLLPDDELRLLQWALVLRPGQGSLIPGAGGLRKLRWSRPGSGKRGGLRVLYYWAPERSRIFLIYVFAKGEKDDLSQRQLQQLAQLVRKELK